MTTSRTRPLSATTSGWSARLRGLTAAAIATLALSPIGVSAQSLLEVYEAARGYDAVYLAARAQAESARFRAEQSEALLRPSAALNGSVTRQETDPPVVDRRSLNNAQLSLQGRQPLYNRASSAAVEQARRSLQAAAAELEAAEQDLIVRVAQAYFDVLASQDSLATVRASKTFITEQLASARRNFEVGNATITDTREAQARFDLVTAQEIAAENDLRTRRIALDQLVGRTGVEPKGLAVPVALPPVTPNAVDDWVTRGQTTHPTIRRAQTAFDIAQLETERARAGQLPTVDLVGSLGSSRSTGSAVALTGRPGTTNSGSIGVQLNLPLYTGGSVQNRIRETLSLEEKARNDLEAARRGVAQGTRQAFFGVQSGQAQVKALEAAESSSQLALEATQTGYRVGVRVNLDVLNAQSQLFTTQRDLARARYDVLLGSLRLRQASGQLGAPDVAALNGLLKP
jgi:outer membrane protein